MLDTWLARSWSYSESEQWPHLIYPDNQKHPKSLSLGVVISVVTHARILNYLIKLFIKSLCSHLSQRPFFFTTSHLVIDGVCLMSKKSDELSLVICQLFGHPSCHYSPVSKFFTEYSMIIIIGRSRSFSKSRKPSSFFANQKINESKMFIFRRTNALTKRLLCLEHSVPLV